MRRRPSSLTPKRAVASCVVEDEARRPWGESSSFRPGNATIWKVWPARRARHLRTPANHEKKHFAIRQMPTPSQSSTSRQVGGPGRASSFSTPTARVHSSADRHRAHRHAAARQLIARCSTWFFANRLWKRQGEHQKRARMRIPSVFGRRGPCIDDARNVTVDQRDDRRGHFCYRIPGV